MILEEKRSDREEVRLLLDTINDAWLKGRPEDLADVLNRCFHNDMVIRGPDLRTVATGREACVRSYEEFLREATVRECTLSDPDIDLWGNTAVATYSWDMTYQMGGQVYHESGHDLFALARGRKGWRAVWRAILPSPPH